MEDLISEELTEEVAEPVKKQRGDPNWKPFNYNTSRKCGGGVTAAGTKCASIAMRGSELCRHHTPVDQKHLLLLADKGRNIAKIRSVVHQRYLALPKDLAARYEKALSDPQLVELKADIAFVESRIQHLTIRIGKIRESRGVLRVIKRTIDALKADVTAGRASYLQALSDLKLLVNKDWSASLMWEEVYALTDQKRKLVDTESKRMKDLEAYLTPEQAFALVSSMVSLAKRYVPEDQQHAFQYELANTLKLTKKDYRNAPTDDHVDALAVIDAVESAVDMDFDPDTGEYYSE